MGIFYNQVDLVQILTQQDMMFDPIMLIVKRSLPVT